MQDLGAADLLKRQLTQRSRLDALWEALSRRLAPYVPAPLRWLWALLGRMGLALRHLLTPVERLLRPVWLFLAPGWAFVGRLGLALRRLLTWFVWKPLLLLTSPVRWIARALSRPATPGAGNRWATSRPPLRLATLVLTVTLTIAGLGSVFTGEPEPSLASTLPELPAVVPTESPTATAVPTQPPRPAATPTPLPTRDLAPWPTPDILGSGGSVAFTLDVAGNSDIYALTMGQADPIRLTDHPAADRDPAWSPDGTQIAFASRRDGNWELYVLDLRAEVLRRVTFDPGFDAGPSWSPDGQWLVFEAYRESNLDIYITRADGSGDPIRLTRDPAPDFAPAWAPGGRHIAFTSWRTGNKDIFILSLDGPGEGRALNITASPGQHEDNPAFSPDGSILAFDDASDGFDLVYGLTLENYQPAEPTVSLGQGRQPTWAPNGQAVLFVHAGGDRSYLFAGSLSAWNLTPQAFASDAPLEDPHWTAAPLPRDLEARLRRDEQPEPLFEELLSPADDGGPPVLLQQITVSAPAPYLSDRVDDAFRAMATRVEVETGFDHLGRLDNLFEPLSYQAAPDGDSRTWNKAGRAFDMQYRPALAFDPVMEVVRQDRGYEVFWTVYLRAEAQDGTQGEPLRELPWDFRARYGQDARYYDEGGRWKDAIPAGYYVDFTALAADYGWQRVPANAAWRTYFPGIRFWHFENRQGLSWEAAMRELYDVEQLADTFGDP